MNKAFGQRIREQRKEFHSIIPEFSLRKVAGRMGLEPSYLSKIERGLAPPPSVATIARMAKWLNLDPDELQGLAGNISSDVRKIILKRPKLMSSLVRQFAKVSDDGVQKTILRARRTGKQ